MYLSVSIIRLNPESYQVAFKDVNNVVQAKEAAMEAWVRKMQSHEGNRLKAWIIPETGEAVEQLQHRLYAWIESHLSVPERPKHLTFSAESPLNQMGKLQDWPMASPPIFPSSDHP